MDPQLLNALDKIGTVGLAFVVYCLLSGVLVTRRELKREIERRIYAEDLAAAWMEIGAKAVGNGEAFVSYLKELREQRRGESRRELS